MYIYSYAQEKIVLSETQFLAKEAELENEISEVGLHIHIHRCIHLYIAYAPSSQVRAQLSQAQLYIDIDI